MSAMLRVLVTCSAVAFAAADDVGWDLIATSVNGPTSRTCFKTPGLPTWLRGNFFVAGPAQFEFGDTKFNGIFDGFGMMNRFELGDQQVCYTSVWLDTMYRNESIEQGCAKGLTFEHTTPRASLLCLTGGGDNNWVNVIKVGEELLLLSDTSIMLRLDMDTLTQSGHKHWMNDKKENPDWATHMPLTGSAHPVRRPGTNTWVGIVSDVTFNPFSSSYVDVLTYDGDVAKPQPRIKIGRSGPLSKPPFLHSFGVTPKYVVLPITLSLGINTHCSEFGHVLCALTKEWQGIHVIDSDGKVTVFADTAHFAHVHIINTFENGTGITVDLGAYDRAPFAKTGALDIAMTKNKTARDANPVKAVPRRLHLHMSGPLAGKVTYKDFDMIPNSAADFFRINQHHIGLPYCFYYATQWWHDSINYASMAIIKHDVCTDTKTYWTQPNFYLGEPTFVPGQSRQEDDGVLLFVALDGAQKRSTLITLDAKTMTKLNQTDVLLAGHIPFTAHGDFFSTTDRLSTFV